VGVYKHETGKWRLRIALAPGVRLSWAFDRKEDAQDYEGTLRAIRSAKRNDLIRYITDHRGQLDELRKAIAREGGVSKVEVDQLVANADATSVGQVAQEFYEYCLQPSAKSRLQRPFAPTTASAYKSHIKRFIKWLPGGATTRLASINETTLAHYHQHRVSVDKLSPVGADRSVTPIQALMSWATDPARRRAGVVAGAHPLRFTKSKAVPAEAKALTAEEMQRVRQHCPPEIWSIFEVTLGLGLRITECLFLRVSDVDFGERIVVIQPHTDRRLKTDSSAREVPIPDGLLKLLRRVVANSDGWHLWSEEWRAKGPSASADAWRAGYHRLAKKWAKACRDANVKATIHALRHTYGSRLADADVPPRDIAALMGHKSVATTERYWRTKETRKRSRAALKAVGATLLTIAAPPVPQSRAKSAKGRGSSAPKKRPATKKTGRQ
jgi:integrase